jgi:hypothetical protein
MENAKANQLFLQQQRNNYIKTVTILQEGSPNRTKLQQNPTTRKE